MKLDSRGVAVFLYFTGLALICLGFALLVFPWLQPDVAWLDLVVACFVYSSDFFGVRMTRGSVAGFHRRIPRLAVFLWGAPLYTIAALSVMWRGVLLHSSFKLQLIVQLGLGFVWCLAATAALAGSEKIAEIDDREERLTAGVHDLKEALAASETALFSRGSTLNGFRPRFERLKEDVRFLSPNASASAHSLEQEIVQVLDAIRGVATAQNDTFTRSELPALMDRCESLLALRRHIRIEHGEQA